MRISGIIATFFSITGLLVLSGDVQVNSLAVGVILLTVAVLSWYSYLSEIRQERIRAEELKAWHKEAKEAAIKHQQLFDQNATQEYNSATDWNK